MVTVERVAAGWLLPDWLVPDRVGSDRLVPDQPSRARVNRSYGRTHAARVVRAAMADYVEAFGAAV